MHKRTRACNISQKTKIIVFQRDHGQCIFCNQKGLPEAHVISRAHGGLGVPQNIITVCRACHDKLDNSTSRQQMLEAAKKYLKGIYPNWNESYLVYDKWHKDKGLSAEVCIIDSNIEPFKASDTQKCDKDKAPPDGFTWF